MTPATPPVVVIPLHKGAEGFMSDQQFRVFYWPAYAGSWMASARQALSRTSSPRALATRGLRSFGRIWCRERPFGTSTKPTYGRRRRLLPASPAFRQTCPSRSCNWARRTGDRVLPPSDRGCRAWWRLRPGRWCGPGQCKGRERGGDGSGSQDRRSLLRNGSAASKRLT